MPVSCHRTGCKKRDTGKMYAMKVMSKNRIKMKNAVDLCWNERVLLAKIKSPFVVRDRSRALPWTTWFGHGDVKCAQIA